MHEGTGLGIQRLRIIDLETGDQPIYNEDRSVVVVLNGEIYNFRELRARLERGGHTFATRTDTEVIAHLYEEEGPRCVESLHGMFAFALWDTNSRQLLIARDRVGKKPLFYYQREGVLTFASELNALLQDEHLPRELDHSALDCYLAYECVPTPLTPFRAVRKLPPASTLLFRGGAVSIDRYWRLDYSRKLAPESPAEVHERIRDAIRAAVQRRLVADVPLGAFLSGGIDSSAVVAAMAEASSEPVKTFSIGFESETLDELEHAQAVASQFATDHNELVVRPNAVEMVPEMVRRYGEPFGEPSALPMFYLAEMARQHVTVALSGDGGDESFAGYPRYPTNVLLGRTDHVPRAVRVAAAGLGARLPTSGTIDSPLSRVRRMALALPLDPPTRYFGYVSQLNGLDRHALYTPEYRQAIEPSCAPEVLLEPWRRSTAAALIDRMLDVDVNTYLPDNHLVKADVATMAHSLEVRSPLLDHELMELAAAVPAEMKVRGLQKKVVLRDALRGWLSDEVLDRPKQGFQLPIAEWFRGELRGWAQDVLLDPAARSRGYFREHYVSELLDEHAAGRRDYSRPIWSLVVLEIWHQQLVDRRPAASTSGRRP